MFRSARTVLVRWRKLISLSHTHARAHRWVGIGRCHPFLWSCGGGDSIVNRTLCNRWSPSCLPPLVTHTNKHTLPLLLYPPPPSPSSPLLGRTLSEVNEITFFFSSICKRFCYYFLQQVHIKIFLVECTGNRKLFVCRPSLGKVPGDGVKAFTLVDEKE